MRGASHDGRIRNPDVQLAIQTRNAFLLVGGYRALGRSISEPSRVEIITRAAGRCRQCGKPGDEIDHISGNSNELENLQLLCADCHHAKTADSMRPASREQDRLLRDLVSTRVKPKEPRLLADDERRWSKEWQGLRKARKERFIATLFEAGVRVRTRDTHEDLLAAFRQLEEMRSPQPQTDSPHDFGPDTFLSEALRRRST